MASIREILLRVTSDSDDAKADLTELGAELHALDAADAEAAVDIDTSAADKSLAEIRADLARFARETAESTAGIDTAAAREQLDALELKLRDFDHESFDATADVDIAKAMAKIALLRAELATLDTDFGPNGTKGLDQLGAASARALVHIGQLADDTGRLGRTMDDTDKRGNVFTRTLGFMRSRVSSLAKTVGDFLTGPVDSFLRKGALLSELLVPLGGALGSLLGSATLAAGGLGALSVAAGAGFLTAIGFAFVAVKRFQQQSAIAGTEAHHLAQAIHGLKAPFDALLPAADPVLQAIARGLRGVGTVLDQINPAVMAFGRDAGHAVGQFFDQITSPRMAGAFSDLIRLAGTALKPIASIMGSLVEIATNLARAAMPLLVKIFGDWADKLKDLAQGSRNIHDLRDGVRGLVDQLQAWAELIGAISKAWLAFAEASAGPAEKLLGFFTDGANALADWANSEAGREKIKQFFKDTRPTVEAIVGLVGDLVKLFISFGQTVAPALKPVIDVIRDVVQWLTRMLEKVRDMEPGPVKDMALALLAFGPVVGIFKSLRFLLGAVVGPLLKLGRLALLPVARGVIALGSALLTRLLPALVAVAPELLVLAGGVVAVYEGMKVGKQLADSWKKKLIDSTDLNTAIDNVQKFVDDTAVSTGAARRTFGELANAAKDKLDEVVTAFKNGGPKAKAATTALGHGALAAIKAFTGDYRDAGSQLIEALAGGQRSKEGAAKNAASDVTRAAKIAAAAFASEFNTVGQDHGDRYAGGVGSKSGAAKNAGSALAQAVKDGLQSVSFTSVVNNIANTIKTGMDIAAALRESGRAAIQAFIDGFTSITVPNPHPGGGAPGPASKVAPAAAVAGNTYQTFYVPASPAAHGQPDPRHTAAQLAMLLKNRGG